MALGYVRRARAFRPADRGLVVAGLEPVERGDEVGPGPRDRHGRLRQDPRQSQTAEVGHTEEREPSRPIRATGVDRHDVGMLQPRQGLWLARAEPADLEHDGSIGQSELLGAENASEGPAAEFLDQPEAGDGLARFGEAPSGVRARRMGSGAGTLGNQAMNLDDFAQAFGDVGEAGLVLDRIGDLSGLLAEAILFVDQGHEGLVIDRRIVPSIPFNVDRLSGLAAQGQIGPEEGQEGPGALAGLGGQEFERVGESAARGAPGRLEPSDQKGDLRRGGLVPGSTEDHRAHGLSPPSDPRPRPGV